MREPQHISQTEMRTLLREAYARDPEKGVLGQLARQLRDPAAPQDAGPRFRTHPLWLTFGLVAIFVAGIFFYFSFLRS